MIKNNPLPIHQPIQYRPPFHTNQTCQMFARAVGAAPRRAITTALQPTRRRHLTTTTVNAAAAEKPLPAQTRVESPDGPKLGKLHSHKVFIAEGQSVKWCACGHSKNQPWCDGSHVGTKFEPVVFTAPESKIYGMCLCKYTNKTAICDGAHKEFVGYVKPVKTATPTPNPPPPEFNI